MATVEGAQSFSLTADVLKIPDVSIVRYACQELGLDESRVLSSSTECPASRSRVQVTPTKGAPMVYMGLIIVRMIQRGVRAVRTQDTSMDL